VRAKYNGYALNGSLTKLIIGEHFNALFQSWKSSNDFSSIANSFSPQKGIHRICNAVNHDFSVTKM
jgi:hypothetical protein